MKPTRSTILPAFVFFTFLIGTAPLFADSVTIGGNGELSINRPFCGV